MRDTFYICCWQLSLHIVAKILTLSFYIIYLSSSCILSLPISHLLPLFHFFLSLSLSLLSPLPSLSLPSLSLPFLSVFPHPVVPLSLAFPRAKHLFITSESNEEILKLDTPVYGNFYTAVSHMTLAHLVIKILYL